MMLKRILLIFECLLMLAFLAAAPVFNSGNISAVAGILLLMTVTVRSDVIKRAWRKGSGKAVLICASVLILSGICYAGILSMKMYKAMSNRPDKPNLIVVLGCQVNGERPSKMLRLRLDAAYDALTEFPDVPCVVTGGKGTGENISEAECMKRYLVEKGIDESRIITEDRSTSTYENVRFTFELTDSLGFGRDITIVTDGYHQYRASLIAKEQDAGEITAISADTELHFLPTYWVREWLGITHYYLFGK